MVSLLNRGLCDLTDTLDIGFQVQEHMLSFLSWFFGCPFGLEEICIVSLLAQGHMLSLLSRSLLDLVES